MPITLRADTSAPILGLNLPRACNDAFSKSTNVKSSATYDIPTHCFRRRNSDVIRELRSAGGRVHRRERWRTRCTTSKAAKAEAVRAGGAFLRNEPNRVSREAILTGERADAILARNSS